MQFNWMYTALLSLVLFALQANGQYTSSSTEPYTPPTPTYTPPTYTTPTYGPPYYPSACTPTTIVTTYTTITTLTVPTTYTSITTTTDTIYTAPYGSSYDTSYMPPMKKKTGLIIGLVIGLCGLAILCLIAFLLWRRSKKPKGKTYESTTTPATGY